MIDGRILRILAMREGGEVNRCHATPRHRPYNNASHSYGVVSLILILHPDPSKRLIEAALWHDSAERWVGDLPAPAKMSSPELAKHYEREEASILNHFQIPAVWQLTPDEQEWLKNCDTLELWLWCREEIHSGNRAIGRMLKACEHITQQRINSGSIPPECEWLFNKLVNQDHIRLPDFFLEVKALESEETEAGLGDRRTAETLRGRIG